MGIEDFRLILTSGRYAKLARVALEGIAGRVFAALRVGLTGAAPPIDATVAAT
jgi:hypothetical protein